MECLICGKEYESKIGFAKHLINYHNINSKNYYINYMKKEIKICLCGKECKFYSLGRGYAKSCGNKNCISKIRTIAQKNKPPDSKETKKKKSKALFRRLPRSMESRLKSSKSLRNNPKLKWNKERKEKQSQKMLKQIQDDPEKSLKLMKKMNKNSHTPEANNKRSKTHRNNYNKLKIDTPSNKNFYLYIMSDGNKLIKIGVSGDPKRRVNELKSHYPKIYIINTYYENFNKVYELETKLHHKYDNYNVILPKEFEGRTEWFKKEILEELIEDLKNERYR